MCKPDYILPCENNLACLPITYRTIRDCQEAYQCCNYECIPRDQPCNYDPNIEDPWLNLPNEGDQDENKDNEPNNTDPGTTDPEENQTDEDEKKAQEEREKYLQEQLEILRKQLEQQVEEEGRAKLEKALAENLQK